MLLLSELEQRGRRLVFHPSTTIVLGKNDTGKSSILKSIYRTFGAEPAMLHPDWRHAEVSSLVRFAVDESQFAILKREGLFAVFGAGGELIARFNSVTRGLGPFLAELFSFNIKLASQKSELITPPPAFMFLPFYIDQDAGWTSNWSSFANLRQIPGFRKSIAEYHTGIRPNEYYVARAALQAAEDTLQKESHEAELLNDVRGRMQEEIGVAEFDTSLEEFRDQLDELLVRCRRLLALEEQLKDELRELHNARAALEANRDVVRHSLHEVSADYQYATTQALHETVDCPTCGATYDNSFVERFAIAKDEDRLGEMLLKVEAELQEVESAIELKRVQFDDNRAEVSELKAILETQKSEMSLAMVLKSEGRKEVRAAFSSRLEESYGRQAQLMATVEQHRGVLKALEDKKRRQDILEEYRSAMRRYLYDLNVTRLPESSYRQIDATIQESGSDRPRALLAYTFSILSVMRQRSTSTFCPVVIDSPNQQAQDEINLPLMLQFIRDNLPVGSQLVLALEDMNGVEFDGDVVTVQQKNKVLLEEEYASVHDEMTPFVMQAIAAG